MVPCFLWQIFQDFSEIDVDIYVAGCQGEWTFSLFFSRLQILSNCCFPSASVVEQLERGDFFSETITKKHLFASVHDAVLYCLNHRGATSVSRYETSVVSGQTTISGFISAVESWQTKCKQPDRSVNSQYPVSVSRQLIIITVSLREMVLVSGPAQQH